MRQCVRMAESHSEFRMCTLGISIQPSGFWIHKQAGCTISAWKPDSRIELQLRLERQRMMLVFILQCICARGIGFFDHPIKLKAGRIFHLGVKEWRTRALGFHRSRRRPPPTCRCWWSQRCNSRSYWGLQPDRMWGSLLLCRILPMSQWFPFSETERKNCRSLRPETRLERENTSGSYTPCYSRASSSENMGTWSYRKHDRSLGWDKWARGHWQKGGIHPRRTRFVRLNHCTPSMWWSLLIPAAHRTKLLSLRENMGIE